jgi:hypothetical protein
LCQSAVQQGPEDMISTNLVLLNLGNDFGSLEVSNDKGIFEGGTPHEICNKEESPTTAVIYEEACLLNDIGSIRSSISSP